MIARIRSSIQVHPMKPLLLFFTLSACCASAITLAPSLPGGVSRPWPGPDFWTNPAEDWICRDGFLENTFPGGNRNVVILTAEVNANSSAFTFRTRIDQTSFELKDGFVGFQIGLRAPSGDYRAAAVSGTSLCVGLNFDGTLFIGGHRATNSFAKPPFHNLTLDLRAEPAEDGTYKLNLTLADPSGKKIDGTSANCDASWLPGLVALTASSQRPPDTAIGSPRPAELPKISCERGGEACFRFSQIILSGDKVSAFPERAFGPILWTTQLPCSDGRTYLLVQAAPFGRQERLDAELYLDGQKFSSAAVDPSSRTARFTARHPDNEHDHTFEIRLAGGSWKGAIHAAPRQRPLTIASLSGDDGTDFPNADLVSNVRAHKPDMITFLGNQISEDAGGYGMVIDQHPNERAALCYLRKYMLHGWTWRDALRDTPSVTLPAEHDIFQSHFWGDNGKAADVSQGYGSRAQDGGGYIISPELANIVHTTQTGNLPPPVDPSACPSRISVFFTEWNYGPIHFAVINDHQFKSPPKDLFPDAAIRNGVPSNANFPHNPPPDLPAAQLLGPRQENFLARWAENHGTEAKFHVLFSQGPFAAIRTTHGNASPSAADDQPTAAGTEVPTMDFNANAWPVGKRNLALQSIGTTSAVHISGGQGLGTTGQYGIHRFNDGPWWIATPPITNHLPNHWTPAVGSLHARQAPPWTGDFADAFGNRFTLHAVANPGTGIPATGYTITTWDPATKHATLANWPSSSSPAKPAPNNQPFPGWPVIIDPASGKRVN